MKPPVFEYCAAHSADEALAFLAEHGDEGRILAGGQSLVPLLNFRMARPSYLIDINRCTELDYVRQNGAAIAIGAMTRQSDAEHNEIVRRCCPLIAEALTYMGHPTIRHRGTIGGSLAHADPGAELPAIAVALGAEIVLRSTSGQRTISAEAFFLDSLVTAIQAGEMLVEARFPVRREGDRHCFLETGVRRSDFAIAGVAAQINVDVLGICRAASLVALGAGSRPTRLINTEAMLANQHVREVNIQAASESCEADLDPASDLQASAAYRRSVIIAMVRRALQALLSDGENR